MDVGALITASRLHLHHGDTQEEQHDGHPLGPRQTLIQHDHHEDGRRDHLHLI